MINDGINHDCINITLYTWSLKKIFVQLVDRNTVNFVKETTIVIL